MIQIFRDDKNEHTCDQIPGGLAEAGYVSERTLDSWVYCPEIGCYGNVQIVVAQATKPDNQ
jgi:hypothetical protein